MIWVGKGSRLGQWMYREGLQSALGTIANACIIEKRNIAAIHKGHLKKDAYTHTERETGF